MRKGIIRGSAAELAHQVGEAPRSYTGGGAERGEGVIGPQWARGWTPDPAAILRVIACLNPKVGHRSA